MSYGMLAGNDAIVGGESSSHLHEIISRINSVTNSVAHIDARLARKNEQMVNLPPSPPQKGENFRDDGSVRPRMPLVDELSKAIADLETRISRLHETILVTETI